MNKVPLMNYQFCGDKMESMGRALTILAMESVKVEMVIAEPTVVD